MADILRSQDSAVYANNIVTYNSYAGTDIVATILLPNETGPIEIGELQTISYSIHRENSPVRTLGHVAPRGFIKGPRTISGSMIFTMFHYYAFYKIQRYARMYSNGLFPLADMMPPFDVTLTFANETGSMSKIAIYGVTIVDEGGVMSIDDILTEQQFTYMARGIQPITSYVTKQMTPSSLESLIVPFINF